MEEHSTSINTGIIRISVLWLALFAITQASISGPSQRQERRDPDRLVVDHLSAIIAEDNFWRGSSLPEHEAVVLYWQKASASVGIAGNSEVLAIVPALNATYRFKLCSETLVLQEGSGISPKIAPEKYLNGEIVRFSDFVARARRSDQVLTINSVPATLFHAGAEFKARRISQIRNAADGLYRERPLQMTIAEFSPFTDQINTLIPRTQQMVTFSVVHSCSSADVVSVGRVLPLASISADLRKRIAANSIDTTIR